MITNLAIDDDLINEALTLGHFKTKEDTVITALKEFITPIVTPSFRHGCRNPVTGM